MQIETIQTEEAWAALAVEWNELLTNSATNVPFLRHEYLTGWWAHRGGGEWPQAELYIVVGRDADGALLGVAPLFFSPNRDGVPALLLLGSIEISDFLDVIVAPENLTAFVAALLAHLTGPDAPAWQRLDFYNLLEESPTLPVLQAAAAELGLTYEQVRDQPAPMITLPGDIDDYLASLDKKYRHEIRRKMRNAASFFLPVTWYVVEDGDTLEDEIEGFFAMMREEEEKAAFLTEEMVAQMKTVARSMFDSGLLHLTFLKVGHDKAACYFNFQYDNKIWVYNSGLARKFDKLSPGIVLTGFLLMDAIENGIEVFDLMRGDEEYKYHLGGQDRFVMRVTIDR